MVPPDSCGISGVPHYLGQPSPAPRSRLRDSHPLRSAFPDDSTSHEHNGRPDGSQIRRPPQPRTCNACRLEHTHGLASSAFARHYSRNHGCFLFLWVLRCFTSPRYLPHPYTFRAGSPDMTPAIQGFPIRTSPDHSSFTNSPGLIAGYNVLHRLLVPRHPPIALSSLSHKPLTQNHIQRCSHPLCSSQPPHETPTTNTNASAAAVFATHQDTTPAGVIPQNPNNVPPHHQPTRASSTDSQCSTPEHPTPTQEARQPWGHTPNHNDQRTTHELLRKEVIQPHLPVRLPCYDLVLITSPTFDGSPTRLGHRLRVLPTFMT